MYTALLNYSARGEYFLDAQMSSGATSSTLHTSLANFFPGLRAQIGDIDGAERQLHVLHAVWNTFGGFPELFDTTRGAIHAGGEGYPLRPELVESFYHACVAAPYLLPSSRRLKRFVSQVHCHARSHLD
jgi:hypothetical protein